MAYPRFLDLFYPYESILSYSLVNHGIFRFSDTKSVVLEAQMDSDGPPQQKLVSNRPLEAIGIAVPPRPSRFGVGRSLRRFFGT